MLPCASHETDAIEMGAAEIDAMYRATVGHGTRDLSSYRGRGVTGPVCGATRGPLVLVAGTIRIANLSSAICADACAISGVGVWPGLVAWVGGGTAAGCLWPAL